MLEQLLASLAGAPPQNRLNMLPPGMDERAAMSNPQAIAAMLGQGPAMGAPSTAPMPQQPAQAPQQPSGGGFLQSLFSPRASGENATIGWLQTQGMDQGTATLLARNKTALQSYLLNRTKGRDPKDALELEKLGLEVDRLKNPQPSFSDQISAARLEFDRSNSQLTTDIREYQAAQKQGYEGTLRDWILESKKAGATTVDARQMGTIPPGYRADYDEAGRVTQLSPIPGGPAAAEQEKAAKADAAKTGKRERTTDIVTQDIDRALALIDDGGLPTTGMIGDWLSNIGGTDARNLKGLLDTIRANSGFETLQAMRESSPTGGALGQVTERELGFLQATIGNLEQSQTAQQLKDNLNRVWNVYQSIVHGEGGYTPRPLSFEVPKAGEVTPEYLKSMPMPKSYKDIGGSEEGWKFMAPEQRKLFLDE